MQQMNWHKKDLEQNAVRELSSSLGIDVLTASILQRRGKTARGELLYFFEKNYRYLHSPFLLAEMEEAVERCLMAFEDETIMIFGDRDVDGVTSTAILYHGLSNFTPRLVYRNPSGADSYGLSNAVIDEAQSLGVTLIITADCGCSNHKEIAYARDLGIDVIVLDHHTPKEERPQAWALVNPCSGLYPFSKISAAVVSGKFLWALAYRETEDLQINCCLLHLEQNEDGLWEVFASKLRDFLVSDSLQMELKSPEDVQQFLAFIQSEMLCSLTYQQTMGAMKEIFGTAVDIYIWDLQEEIKKLFPSLHQKSPEELHRKSRLARYVDSGSFDSQVQLLITILQASLETPQRLLEESIELMAVSTIADMMPLLDENRIIVKQGLERLYENPRPGLRELLLELGLLGQDLNAKELSWRLIPVLNAAGRMGATEVVTELLISDDIGRRLELAKKLVALNQERRQQSEEFAFLALEQAEKSFAESKGRLVFVALEAMPRGLTGIIANRLCQQYKVPSVVLSKGEGTWSASLRSGGSPSILSLLDPLAELFIDYGGHEAAGGFSIRAEDFPQLRPRLFSLVASLEVEPEREEQYEIDAEIPAKNLSAKFLEQIWESLAPYGMEWPELLLLSKAVQIMDIQAMGKPEDGHLRMNLSTGAEEAAGDGTGGGKQMTAVFWRAAERHLKDFAKGDIVDILYRIKLNFYQGQKRTQLEIVDICRSEK